MSSHDFIYDILNEIRDNISEEEFKNLVDKYCELHNKCLIPLLEAYFLDSDLNKKLNKKALEIVKQSSYDDELSSKIESELEIFENNNVPYADRFLQLAKMLSKEDEVLPFISDILESLYDNNQIGQCNCNGDDICLKQDIKQIWKCKNYTKFIELNPIFNLFFDDDHEINLTTEPIYYPNESFFVIRQNFRNLNSLTNYYKDDLSLLPILTTALYDYSMKNLFFLQSQSRETLIDIYQLLSFRRFEGFIRFYEKHNINPDIWLDAFEKTLQIREIKNEEEEIPQSTLSIFRNKNKKINIGKVMDSVFENYYKSN